MEKRIISISSRVIQVLLLVVILKVRKKRENNNRQAKMDIWMAMGTRDPLTHG
jgi:hypothetical protein